MRSDERWITYRGAVDAWECDQMQHMNIQHYAHRVSRAERYFLAGMGLSARDLERSCLSVRTAREDLRFVKELRVASPIIGRSIPLRIDNNELHLEHQLLNDLQGDVCMTSHTRYRLVDRAEANAGWPKVVQDAIDGSGGISSLEPVKPSPVRATVFKECGRTIVLDGDCEADELTREALVRLVNHACSHVGLEHGRQWDAGRLLVGSATLHLQITRHAPILPGTMLVVRSKLEAGAGKTVYTMHRVCDADSQQEVATIRTTNIFFDVSSRRAIEIPASVSKLLSQNPTSGSST